MLITFLVIIVVFQLKLGLLYALGLSALLSVVVVIKQQLGLTGMISALAMLNLSPFLIKFFVDKLDKKLESSSEEIAGIQDNKQFLSAENTSLVNLNSQLETDMNELAGLYELARIMGEQLELFDTLLVYSYIIENVFSFKQARLSLVNSEDSEHIKLKNVYLIKPAMAAKRPNSILNLKDIMEDLPKSAQQKKEFYAKRIFQEQPSALDSDLLNIMISENNQIIISTDKNKAYMDRLGIRSNSFVALSLVVENKLLGILSVEGLDEKDFERFFITGRQFALGLKKVILYQAIQVLAIIDDNTQVFVRRHLLERLNEELLRAKRHKLDLSLLMIDIDHFKRINDDYGHLVGDVLLSQIAGLLRSHIREVDMLGRFGGEEFCVILPETNKENALAAAERLRHGVESQQFKAYDESIMSTISIGVTVFPADGNSIQELIENADAALYRAKNLGRNKICDHSK